MNRQRMVFTLLGVAGLGVAVLALVIGAKGAGDVVSLVSAFFSLATGAVSFAAGRRPSDDPEGSGPTGSGPPPTARSALRRRRWLLPATLAVLLVALATLAVLRLTDGWRENRATPIGSASVPPPAATTSPTTADRTTRAAPTPTGPAWIPPADAPKWTLRANDSVSFLPEPKVTRGGGGGLVFQPQWEQLAWYQWTDDPKDLSYDGCRNPKAKRWDSINLREVGGKPRTYCQPDPADPTVVNYLRILANHYDGDPPSVQVQVWSVHP